MGSSNKGIWLVIALGAVAGVGFAVYYMSVLGPAEERREMTGQIEEWAAKKWYPTRQCLVGDEPRASNGYDAIVLRAAIPGDSPPMAGECRAFFGDLGRPGETSSGNPKVEADWSDVEEAVGRLANAYATYTPDEHTSREAVGTALDAVDAAYARLREAAGMKPSTVHLSRRGPIRDAAATALSLNGEPLSPEGVDLFGSGLAVHGTVRGAQVMALVHGPKEIRIRHLRGEARPAAAETPWGVWTRTSPGGRVELRAGALTPDGLPADEGALLMRTKSGQLPTPIFALGDGNERLVVYDVFEEESPTAYRVARSRDAGATWPEKTAIDAGGAVTVFPDWIRRRVDIAWTGTGDAVRWVGFESPVTPGSPAPEPRVLFASESPGAGGAGARPAIGDYLELRSCTSGSASWWLALGAVDAARLSYAKLGETGPARPVRGAERVTMIAACDHEQLLGVVGDSERAMLVLCTRDGCREAFGVPLAGDGQFAATLGPVTGPVAATATNDLLVLWRGDGEDPVRAVFRGPEVDTTAGDLLRALVEWDGVLHAVIAKAGQVKLAALPLE